MKYNWIPHTLALDETVESLFLDRPIEVEALRMYYPNLKHINIHCYDVKKHPEHFEMYDYLDALCQTFAFESFSCTLMPMPSLPASLWRNSLKELHLNLLEIKDTNVFATLPKDFQNQLKSISLLHAQVVPDQLFDSETIQKIHLYRFSGVLPAIHLATQLESLTFESIYNVDIHWFAKAFKKLQKLIFIYCDMHTLPDWSDLENLTILELQNLNHLKSLENNWDALKKLEQLTIKSINNDMDKTLYFNVLPCLKHLEIQSIGVRDGSPFLGAMPVLESIGLSLLSSITRFPEVIFASPHLNAYHIWGISEWNIVPTKWQNHFHTPGCLIHLYNCYQLKLPKEIFNNINLTNFIHDYPHYLKTKISNTILEKKLMESLVGVPKEQRLALGYLLFGGQDEVSEWVDFREHFFKLLNIKNNIIKSLVRDNLELLHPPHQQLSIPTSDFVGKTMTILGSTYKLKKVYKEKLVALNINYQSIVKKDTEWLIVGDAFDAPPHFWDYPHFFFTEQALDVFLKETNPGFLQTASALECDNIRALLWSNDVANERLVLEMIKTAGIPTEILPDLVLIAKNSADDNLKMALRKLLKVELSPEVQKIVSDQHRLSKPQLFIRYSEFAPEFDVAQMVVCEYKRTGRFLKTFFQVPQSLNNPYRKELFEIARKTLKQKGKQWDTSYWCFTEAELKMIKSNPPKLNP